MSLKMAGGREAIRYSEAFKLQAVQELESKGLSFDSVRRKYGVKGTWTVQRWVHKYGNGTRGKVVRVEKPEEISELARLKQRVRLLEGALADSNLDLALERAYVRLACERAGIQDVEEFKKKADGPPRTKP
jgi:transposase